MKTQITVRKKLKILMMMTFAAGIVTAVTIGLVFLLYMKDTVKSIGTVNSVERLEIVSPANGLLKEIGKKEGDRVLKGDVLLEISSEELTDKLIDIEGDIAEQKALLELAKCKLDVIKQNPLPDKLWNIDTVVKLNLAKKKKSCSDFERAEKLYKRKIISEKSFREIELECEMAGSEYEKSCRLKKIIDQGLGKNIIRLSRSEVYLAEAKIKIMERKFEVIKNKIALCRITAPHSGVVQIIPETSGLYIKKNEPLIRIVWGEKKYIRTLVHEKDIQDVKRKQDVICYSALYDRFRTGAFKGKVSRILSEVKRKNDGRFYQVDIKLMEEPKALRLGSTVDVQIITGRKTIFHALTKDF